MDAENQPKEYLPTEIIEKIISEHLDVKEAARTSILSKDWLHFWNSIPNVEFDEGYFSREGHSFIEFIRTRMTLRRNSNQKIKKFSLILSTMTEERNLVDECVMFAVEHEATWVTFKFADSEPLAYRFPSTFYEKGNCIEYLSIHYCASLRVSQIMSFARLKFLNLTGVDGEFDSKILENCTNLEGLVLTRCRGFSDLLEVKGPLIRSLAIQDCLLGSKLTISAPMLRSLRFVSSVKCPHVFDFHRQSSMEIAQLVLCNVPHREEHSLAAMIFKLLQSIQCIRELTLCSRILRLLPFVNPHDHHILPLQFQQLRHLTLYSTVHVVELLGIRALIQTSPRLESLKIKILQWTEKPEQEAEDCYISYNGELKDFHQKSLRKIVIEGFNGEQQQLQLLTYFIRCATPTEPKRIHISYDSDISIVDRKKINDLISSLMQDIVA